MDFDLNDDERALQDGVRAFLTARAPIESARACEDHGGTIDRQQWREIAQLGVFSLLADGFGITEAALVFEELGYALVPGPLAPSLLAAQIVPGVADGSCIAGIVEPSEPVTVVEHLSSVDTLLVAGPDGVRRLDPSSIDAEPVDRPLDALTPIALVRMLPAGEQIADSVTAARWRRDGMVLTAALQLGICRATVDLARTYAMHREQFGRPIGSFQAVKHMLADMLTRTEVTRAAVHAAAVTIDGRGGGGDLHQRVRTAKILAGDSALFCAKTCVQVHGGMGFTWDVDAQRYWKRACVLDTHFGNSDHHAAEFAEAM